MLILSRRCQEEIVIDDRVTVKVLRASGGKVKLGVIAPPEVRIRRSEPANGHLLDCGPVLILDAEPVAG